MSKVNTTISVAEAYTKGINGSTEVWIIPSDTKGPRAAVFKLIDFPELEQDSVSDLVGRTISYQRASFGDRNPQVL